MPLLTRNRAALIFALPAILVPVIEIPLVFWARHTFLVLHPDYMDDPPTISRSINDPVIGAPFADLILLIAALLAIVMPIIIWGYVLAISRLTLTPRQLTAMRLLLILFFACQVAASIGMVLTTQFTFDTGQDTHMLGSYIFFVFQALAVLLAATLCRMLLRQQNLQRIPDEHWQFRPAMHRFRFRFALLIVALAILYGILFVLKDHSLPVSAYAMQIAYTQCEVLVISCFVLFLGSYAVDINHMVRGDRLQSPLKARQAIEGQSRGAVQAEK